MPQIVHKHAIKYSSMTCSYCENIILIVCKLQRKIYVSPELLLHLLQCVARDDKHLIHVISQHVAGVADVHCCL